MNYSQEILTALKSRNVSKALKLFQVLTSFKIRPKFATIMVTVFKSLPGMLL